MELFKNKKIDKDWSFSEYKPSDTSKWTNCYHRYPAKFIPQLVEKLFDEYIKTDNAHINDPFMGSRVGVNLFTLKKVKSAIRQILREKKQIV